MKKFYLATLLLYSFFIQAQKSVDLDRYRISVQYRSLPKVKLDTGYHTYNVRVSGTQLMNSFMNEINPERSVMMEGWRKLEEGGHLLVEVKLGDLLPGALSIKERTENIKNGNGVITGTRTYYSQELSYSFEATASISDFKGMHIMDQQLANRQHQRIYRSPEFPFRHLAEGYFLVNSIAVTKQLFKESVNNCMHLLSEQLNDNFGYNAVTANDYMWIIDSRKHPEYNAHRNAFRQLNEVIFSIDANTPLDGVREKLQPVISYFEKIKTTYSSSSKHDRKIRYASYFNLAVLYYYLDDPQAMMKEARGLELNDFDAKDARGFIQTATWLQDLFKQSNIYTRHFPIDVNQYRGPFEKTVYTGPKSKSTE